MKRRVEIEKVATEVQAALGRAEGFRKYIIEFGVWEIVAKIFASDEYVFDVMELVPKLQATGQVALLQELKEKYFPDKDVIKDFPGYVKRP